MFHLFQLTSSTLRQQGDTCFNYCSPCDTSISRQRSQISKEHDVLRADRLVLTQLHLQALKRCFCHREQANVLFASISAVSLTVYVNILTTAEIQNLCPTRRHGRRRTNLKHQRWSSSHPQPRFFSTPQRSQVFRQQGSLLSMSMMVMALWKPAQHHQTRHLPVEEEPAVTLSQTCGRTWSCQMLVLSMAALSTVRFMRAMSMLSSRM